MSASKFCRICVVECKNAENMQPLFDPENSQCAALVKQIEECGGIMLKPLQEFPKNICKKCLDALRTSYKFRRMCQASEQSILNIIVKPEPKTEHSSQSFEDEPLMPIDADQEFFFNIHNTEFINAEEVDIDEVTDCHDDQKTNERNVIEENESSTNSVLQTPSDIGSLSDEEFKPKRTKKERGVYRKKLLKLKQTKHKKRKIKSHIKNNTKIVDVKEEATLPEGVKKKSRGRKKKIEDQPLAIMCEVCGNIYSKQSLLNMHMRRHLEDKPFECEICHKTFACPSEIRRHMRVHTGERPYSCKFCNRTFADRSTNLKHERIHTNTRPFQCGTCGKSFTYSNVLKNHMLIHTGEKPFLCKPCNKTFSRKHQLAQHIATLTHQQTALNVKPVKELKLKDKERTIQ